MKTGIRGAFGAAVFLWVLCAQGGAGTPSAPSTTTTLSLPDVVANPGQTIQVPISATSADGVFGIDMTITYNPAVLTAQNVTAEGIASSANFSLIRNLNTPGTILISMYGSQDPLAGSGEIAHIQFQVAGGAGTSTALTFTHASINEGNITAVTDHGSVGVVAPGATLTMPDTANGGPGAVVNVPIGISTASDVLAVDLTITYDSAVLNAQDVTIAGIGAAAGFNLVKNLSTPGLIYITAYASGPTLTGSGDLASIQFHVTGAPGDTSALTFTAASVNEGDVPSTVDHGLFTVTCAGAPNGTPCTDGEGVCTPVDTCQGGVCVGTPLDCDDGNPCTVDSCVPGVGCSHTAGNAGAVCRPSAGECDVAETCNGTSAACPADAVRPSGFACADDANACTTDQCNGSSVACQHPAGNAGTVCRAAAGACDLPESCDGNSAACPADALVAVGTECRASTGECDVAESCTGTSAACPADALRPSGFACSDDANVCTTDQCNGASAACEHAPGNAGAVCRASAGICDVAESCTGTSASCPADGFVGAGTECRASAGECDVAESCTGTSASCPSDAVRPSGFACTDDANVCTTDQCNGSSVTCQHPAGNAGTVCRAAAGACDVAESCTGTSASCPADGFVGVGTECRASAGECDVAESCTGSSAACPADALRPSGFACTDDANVCTTDQCNGASAACQHAPGNAGAVCRASAGGCDVAESCTGTSTSCPADGFVGAGTECRASAGECDVAESCTGTSAACPADAVRPSGFACTDDLNVCTTDQCNGSSVTCQHAPGNAGTVCRSATGECDVAEACTGTSATCPADAVRPSGFACTDDLNVCTTDQCNGSSVTCQHAPGNAGAVCRASAGECDVADLCTGTSAACPSDAVRPSGFACTDDANVCTTDLCNGSSVTCQHAAGNAGTVCRASAGICDVAESCTGTSATCPTNAFVPSGTECRASTGFCDPAESCTGSTAACPANAFQPNGTSCNDADAGTCTDVCSSGVCAGTPVAEPPAIDNSLAVDKVGGGNAKISWTSSPGPYNVYRGSNTEAVSWLYDQSCLVTHTTSTQVNDNTAPTPNTFFYYLVSRVSSCRESILGTDGSGATIPNNNSCP